MRMEMTSMTSVSDLKACFKCGDSKQRDEFYAHPQMADGLLGKCKDCTRADMRALRLKDPEAYRDRHRKAWALKRLRRTYRPHASAPLAAKKYVQRNPEKRRAHVMTGNALRDGRLVREPCFMCGSEKSEAHHENYSKPLAVVWLCHAHHSGWHRLKRQVLRVAGTILAEDT
jgi:hypothetical protein